MKSLSICILVLLMGSFIQTSLQVDPLPQSVIDYSTARMERLHHSNFHQTRILWNYLSAGEQYALGVLGWAPPRPAYAVLPDMSALPLTGTLGEDFLFMHRHMIQKINSIGAADGWSVVGWVDCPPPGDADWPVPDAYLLLEDPATGAVINQTKTDDFYYNTIVPEEEWLKNETNLQSVTLGELGVRLENDIHTWFHQRFSAAQTVGYRIQNIHPTQYVPTKWDVQEYTWLADFYSAHTNPYFWKIHGWLESKISAWQTANNVTTIQWAGTWEGGPMSMGIQTQLEQVAQYYSNPTPTTSTSSDPKTGIILGCVLGGLAIIGAFILAIVYLLKIKASKQAAKYSSGKASTVV